MAKTPNKKAAAKIVFGNKERKQFPDPEGLEREKPSSAIEGPTQPLGFGYRLRSKFSEQVSEIGLEKQRNEKMLNRGMRQTFASRSNKRPKHLQHPAPVRGGQYRSTPQMERPHYEETEKMSTKSFREFMTEAAKRGRPRKLRPGEEADTLHIQDQLSKLTHPNHVDVHFKDDSKHRIPREHANMALHHLNSLKPIDRADHAAHMAKGHTEFYHVLSKKSIPSKKKTITLAGPKLRKEEAEHDDDGWYAHKEMHGSKAISKEDWKKGVRPKKSVKKEEVELEESHRVGVTYSDPNSSAVSQRSEKKFKNVRVKAASEEEAIAKAKKHVKKQGYRVHGAEITTMKEEVEIIDETSQAKKDRYVERSASQASMANFTKRHATGKTKEDAENIERKRKAGLRMALKSKMDEEVEQVDELSQPTLSNYSKKADISRKAANHRAQADKLEGNKEGYKRHSAKAKKRKDGMEKAAVRWVAMNGYKPAKKNPFGAKMPASYIRKEDVEQIDEWGRQAITGPHAKTGSMAITPPRVGYKGKQKKPKVQTLTREEIELYNSLSDEHKAIFEKMSRDELNMMVADYHARGGKTKTAEYKPPKDSEKTWPASKMKGSKWASTAGSISRKNQGYKK